MAGSYGVYGSGGNQVEEWGIVGHTQPVPTPEPAWVGDPPAASLVSSEGGPAPWLSVDNFGNLYVYGTAVANSFFQYSPSPGAGALVASMSGVAGTDSYGNPFVAGVATYQTIGGTLYAFQLNGTQLNVLVAAVGNVGWTTVASLQYTSSLGLSLTSTGPISANEIKAVQPGSSPPTAEVWHALQLQTGWTAVTGQTPSYRLTVTGDVELAGRVTGSVTTLIATLPSQYSPTQTLSVPMTVISGTVTSLNETPRLHVDTAGNITPFGMNAAAMTLCLDGMTFPLSAFSGTPAPPAVPLMGATIVVNAYDSNNATNAQDWDNFFTGGNAFTCPPPAATFQKIFYQEGNWPGTIPTRASQLITTLNTRILLCLKPWRDPTNTYNPSSLTPGGNTFAQEKTNVQNAVAMYVGQWSGGQTHLEVCLWQEANDASFFGSGADYIDYFNFYAPAVTANAGVELVLDLGWSGKQFSNYFPGANANLAKFYLDYYCDAYTSSTGGDGGAALTTCQGLAQNAGISFGLAEWGYTANATTITLSQFQTYVNYLQAFFTNQWNNGLPVAALSYFNGQLTGNSQQNVVTGSSDPKVPIIKTFYNAMQAL